MSCSDHQVRLEKSASKSEHGSQAVVLWLSRAEVKKPIHVCRSCECGSDVSKHIRLPAYLVAFQHTSPQMNLLACGPMIIKFEA